jgi:hypothetical protein
VYYKSVVLNKGSLTSRALKQPDFLPEDMKNKCSELAEREEENMYTAEHCVFPFFRLLANVIEIMVRGPSSCEGRSD